MEAIFCSATGRSAGPVLVFAIASTTSMPSVTLPNAAYCPSRCLASSCMMKNWLPAEFGELERAMESTPRLCLRSFFTPLNRNSPLMQ